MWNLRHNWSHISYGSAFSSCLCMGRLTSHSERGSAPDLVVATSLSKRFKPGTVVSRYYDTAGIRKKYHNIQTVELSSTNF